MISSAELLSAFESCQRRGHWAQSWQRHKLSSMEMFHAAVREALIYDIPDPGEIAGETFVTLARDRGLEVPSSVNLYYCAVNHAAAANLIVTAIRQNGERWLPISEPPANSWIPSVLMNPAGTQLRRFLAVSTWSDDREFFEKHSWFCLGEIAHYQMPMQLVVALIGPMSGGRRHHHWSKALLHPYGSELRFRRRRRAGIEGFKETWLKVYREDHDEIPREKWLQGMIDDDVMSESLFVVNIPVPEETQLTLIRELAERKLERLRTIIALPDKQLSTCHSPLHPCPFRCCCWSQPDSWPEDGGFDRVEGLTQQPHRGYPSAS